MIHNYTNNIQFRTCLWEQTKYVSNSKMSQSHENFWLNSPDLFVYPKPTAKEKCHLNLVENTYHKLSRNMLTPTPLCQNNRMKHCNVACVPSIETITMLCFNYIANNMMLHVLCNVIFFQCNFWNLYRLLCNSWI